MGTGVLGVTVTVTGPLGTELGNAHTTSRAHICVHFCTSQAEETHEKTVSSLRSDSKPAAQSFSPPLVCNFFLWQCLFSLLPSPTRCLPTCRQSFRCPPHLVSEPLTHPPRETSPDHGTALGSVISVSSHGVPGSCWCPKCESLSPLPPASLLVVSFVLYLVRPYRL